MYKDLNLTKTKTKPLESVVKFFITLSAFAAILISIAIVFTLLTEAINFFQDPEVTIREYFTATRWTPTFKNPVYGGLTFDFFNPLYRIDCMFDLFSFRFVFSNLPF